MTWKIMHHQPCNIALSFTIRVHAFSQFCHWAHWRICCVEFETMDYPKHYNLTTEQSLQHHQSRMRVRAVLQSVVWLTLRVVGAGLAAGVVGLVGLHDQRQAVEVVPPEVLLGDAGILYDGNGCLSYCFIVAEISASKAIFIAELIRSISVCI